MDDPRIIIIPFILILKNLLETTDIEIFSAPQNPYLFSEAVVVDSKEGRFGQTNFVRDEKDSRYIKVEHTSFAFLPANLILPKVIWFFLKRESC